MLLQLQLHPPQTQMIIMQRKPILIQSWSGLMHYWQFHQKSIRGLHRGSCHSSQKFQRATGFKLSGSCPNNIDTE